MRKPALAIFPMTAGLEDSRLYFNIAFFVVLVSLIVQGWTIAPAARLLGLEIPRSAEPLERFNLNIRGHLEREIACYGVIAGSIVANRRLRDLPLPEDTHITTVVRENRVLTVDERLTLLPGDFVYIFTDPTHIPQLNRLFDPHRGPERLEEHRFYGDFVLDGTADLRDVLDAYGLQLDDARSDETLAKYLDRVFHGRAVIGDRINLGKADLVVKQLDGGRISKVGLRLRQH